MLVLRSLTFAKVADQLGHLFWMGLLAAAVGYIAGVAYFVWLMGVELLVFQAHVARHHPVDGWLRNRWYGIVGLLIAMIGSGMMTISRHDSRYWLILAGMAFIGAGHLTVSNYVHNLNHDWGRQHVNIAAIVIGITVALFGAFLIRP